MAVFTCFTSAASFVHRPNLHILNHHRPCPKADRHDGDDDQEFREGEGQMVASMRKDRAGPFGDPRGRMWMGHGENDVLRRVIIEIMIFM